MVTVIIIGSTIALFVCLLLLTNRPLLAPAVFASVFLVLLTLPMLEKLIVNRVLPIPYLRFSLLAGAPFAFGPLLYLYVRSIIAPGSIRTLPSLGHFVPLVLSMVFLALSPKTLPPGQLGAPEAELPFLSWLLIPSLLGYSVMIFVVLRRHRKVVPDYFSHDSLAVNLKWLNWLTLSFVIMYLLVIAGAWVHSFEIDTGTTVFIVVFGFAALKQPRIFFSTREEPARVKYERSGLRESDAATLLVRLEELMDTARPWLDPDLSIEMLAATLGAPRHYLTQVINGKRGQNFFRLVNEYRIREVKRRINQGDADQLSLLGLAFDCGFNSKSSFNQAFKTIQGCTPSEYRRKSVRT